MEAVLLTRKGEQGTVWHTWGRTEFAVVQIFQKFEEIRRHKVRAWKFDVLSTKSSTLLERKRFKCKYYWRRQLQTLKRSAKRRQLVVEHGKGNKPQAARELTEAEEDKLFECGEFASSNQTILQRTLWWIIALRFRARGFRARDESRRLKWGDVTLEKDPDTGWDSWVEIWARVQNTSRPRQAIQCSCFPSYCASNRQWALPG